MRLSAEKIEATKQKAGHAFGSRENVCLMDSRSKGQQGFTLVELIVIIVIIGIISVTAIPRFFDKNVFDSRGFYDQVISTLRYAQKTAVAQHRLVCVAFAADRITLTIDASIPPDGACDAAPAGNLTGPSGQTPYTVTAPSGVTFVVPAVGTTFSFDALGRPSATPVISVSGYSTAITVEAETGYVH